MAAREKSARKLGRQGRPWSGIERDLRGRYGELLAGIDEVGRGPLAGPVVACAIIMPPGVRAIIGVDDSKQLTAAQREVLAEKILSRAVAVSLGAASSREIDRINILRATVLAMRRALNGLDLRPHHVVVDGKEVQGLGVPHTAVIGGDGKCYAVACASIVAKVTRDRLMARLALRYPVYGWERNAGYATAHHLGAVEAHGLTPHHRKSFLTKQLAFDFS